MGRVSAKALIMLVSGRGEVDRDAAGGTSPMRLGAAFAGRAGHATLREL